jgi:drug/metabolite transporter (DMT)-like permease
MSSDSLALVAALLFALGAVLQQRAALEAPAATSTGFLRSILTKPIWLAGATSQGVGWVVQAAALDRGDLFSVQLIVSLQVVIALPLGVLLTAQRVSRREWIGATAVVVGLGLFVALANPATGRSDAPAATWLAAAAAVALAIVALVSVALRARPAQRAALLAVAAGAVFGFQAAATKVFVGVVGNGISAILSSWSTYGLVACAVTGFFLTQLSLQAGVLAATVAASNASTTLTSLALSRFVFLEVPSRTASGKAVSLAAVALAVAGLIAVGRGAQQRTGEARAANVC